MLSVNWRWRNKMKLKPTEIKPNHQMNDQKDKAKLKHHTKLNYKIQLAQSKYSYLLMGLVIAINIDLFLLLAIRMKPN